jgi:hypothetical protein
MAEIVIVCGNVFTAFQNATHTRPANLKVEIPSDTLQVYHFVEYTQNPKHLEASNQLYIYDEARVSEIKLSAGNFLELSQSVIRSKYGLATNYISFAQIARKVKHELLENVLSISQLIVVGRGVYNTITFTQSLVLHKSKVERITHTLGLTQAVSVYKYNEPDFTAIAADSGTQSFTPLILTYGSSVLSLCIPDFGDKWEIEDVRINREVRGGERIIFRDPTWPQTEKLTFKLSNLSQFQVKAALGFIQDTLGLTITLTDHYGDTWEGIIINPDTEAEQNVRANSDNCPAFSMEIDFQGVQV